MNVPRNFNRITIDLLQRIPPITKDSNVDEWVLALSVLSNKTPDYFEAMPLWKLKYYINQSAWLVNPRINIRKKRYLFLKGNLYRADFEANTINTAQGIDIKTFLKPVGKVTQEQHIIDNSHKLLACVYRQFNWKKLKFEYRGDKHEEISKDFLSCKVGSVYGTLFFYSKVWENLMPALVVYGEQAAQLIVETMKEIEEWAQTPNKSTEIIGGGR